MRIAPALQTVVDELRAAGYRADVDATLLDLNPAAVWVTPRELLDMRQTLRVWLYLIIGNTETARALELLDDALEGVLELLGALPDDDEVIDLAAAVILPGHPAPLPAYRVQIDLDLPGDQE